MSTVSHREIVDQIIAGDGWYPGDQIRVTKIVQYNNVFNGDLAWGLVYETDIDQEKYEHAENCRNPTVIFTADP